MTIRRIFALTALLGTLALASSGNAQSPISSPSDASKPASIDRIKLYDSLEKPSDRNERSLPSSAQLSASEIRQARALHRADQRAARLDYNLWMGVNPLRPDWNAVPMTHSNYNYIQRRVYVPFYVHAR
ncbi:hypothetical protein [Rubripirellula reticaptiva]|uniref:Uncharacterized protein n=1 Tax=Rubripirellula reticaptiva TaxID=2528013 RepID=A0A5C6F3G8_9BACT|nr:hypothetical protein [Rubripirellula reticaptiva]TWU55050.1 hypothetical protein Poly59_13430 [Rubripirellula reticaptiva]